MKYENLILDEERALYAVRNAEVINCRFDGPADGESALKECSDVTLRNCYMNLRYPLWHVTRATIADSEMTVNCRAALWYDREIYIKNSKMNGIKAVRECEGVMLDSCNIVSPEFGWMSSDIKLTDCTLEGEYPFLKTSGLELTRVQLKGKYSFQYVENMVIRDSYLDTKDAFWHSRNVTVYDSTIKGEYLAWYSENLRLVRCRIIGTQPLCYAKGLVLEDCEMIDADLSFERSEVEATIKGEVISVKNPISGYIEADRIGEIILDDTLPEPSTCKITEKDLIKG